MIIMEGYEDSEEYKDYEGRERQGGGPVAKMEVGIDELGRGVRDLLRGMVGSHDGGHRHLGRAGTPGGPLVELAIGNGREAIPIAQATDQRVIGIDSSPAMLAQARARAAEAGVEFDL